MLKRAFEEDLRICWFLYVDGVRCRVTEYLDKRPATDRDKVCARMIEWARNGNWNVRVAFVKRLDLSGHKGEIPIYEVKSHQDRILFIRRGMNAIAFDALQKKNDWSKKDKHTLEAATVVASAANKENGK